MHTNAHLHSHALIVYFNPRHVPSALQLTTLVRSQWDWYDMLRHVATRCDTFLQVQVLSRGIASGPPFWIKYLRMFRLIQTPKNSNSVQPYSNRGFHIVTPRWTPLVDVGCMVVMNRMPNIHSNINRNSAERCRKWHRKYRKWPRYTW